MIRVYWDTTQAVAVVRLDYADPIVSWAEYDAAIEQANALVAARAPDAVHVIHNPGQAHMPPGNPLVHLRQAVESAPDNISGLWMVVHNPLARYITQATLKMVVTSEKVAKYTFVQSLDDAYAQIQVRELQHKNA